MLCWRCYLCMHWAAFAFVAVTGCSSHKMMHPFIVYLPESLSLSPFYRCLLRVWRLMQVSRLAPTGSVHWASGVLCKAEPHYCWCFTAFWDSGDENEAHQPKSPTRPGASPCKCSASGQAPGSEVDMVRRPTAVEVQTGSVTAGLGNIHGLQQHLLSDASAPSPLPRLGIMPNMPASNRTAPLLPLDGATGKVSFCTGCVLRCLIRTS